MYKLTNLVIDRTLECSFSWIGEFWTFLERWNSCTYTIILLGILDMSLWMTLKFFFPRGRHAIKKNTLKIKGRRKEKQLVNEVHKYTINSIHLHLFICTKKITPFSIINSFKIFLFEAEPQSYYKYFKQWLWFHF